MSIWNRGPDRIPDMIGALNMSLYKALVGIQKRVQGPQYKNVTTVALGASPATYTNDYPYDVDVNCNAPGGGVLNTVVLTVPLIWPGPASVTVYNNPVGSANTCSGLIRLSPGDSVEVTYTTAAPTFQVIER